MCSNTRIFTFIYFNSQPHKEADYSVFPEFSLVRYFNSQPHKEADNYPDIIREELINFNSQPHKEADRPPAICYVDDWIFQFTASQGG